MRASSDARWLVRRLGQWLGGFLVGVGAFGTRSKRRRSLSAIALVAIVAVFAVPAALLALGDTIPSTQAVTFVVPRTNITYGRTIVLGHFPSGGPFNYVFNLSGDVATHSPSGLEHVTCQLSAGTPPRKIGSFTHTGPGDFLPGTNYPADVVSITGTQVVQGGDALRLDCQTQFASDAILGDAQVVATRVTDSTRVASPGPLPPPVLLQMLRENTLAAGKTTALRLWVDPDVYSLYSSIRATVQRPDGSTATKSWTRAATRTVVASTGNSIIALITGDAFPQVGTYSVTAQALNSSGAVLENFVVGSATFNPSRMFRVLVVPEIKAGDPNLQVTPAWLTAIRNAMSRFGADYPIPDDVHEGYRNPQAAGLEYVIGNACDGWTTGYYDCVYGQTRSWNAQAGPDIDITIERRPQDPGEDFGGNSGRPPAPYSDLRRASCVINFDMMTGCFGQEIGHNWGLEPPCSPHWDGGAHSKDPDISTVFAFDALKNAPYTTRGDFMSNIGGNPAWGTNGDDHSVLNSFDYEFLRNSLVTGNGSCT
jgi:hypothetical protein